jgi:phenylacetic acid degradation operon negative regulatory protein
MVKGEKIAELLEIIRDGIEATSDILNIFLCGYPESYRKLKKSVFCPTLPEKDSGTRRQQIYSALNSLKRQGLISKTSKSFGETAWKITKAGLEKIRSVKERNFIYRTRHSKKECDGKLRIIIFDIPEEKRCKRAWLRDVLAALDFSLLQRSVWLGKNRFPDWLIKEFITTGLMKYIHIFEITKSGTINQI